MRSGAYAVFGSLVLAALVWAHFTGWTPGTASETQVPKSLRDNPGSARSSYGPRSTTGAK